MLEREPGRRRGQWHGATGGNGAGGMGGMGGSGMGGTGGQDLPPLPRPTGVVLDSGGAILISPQYRMQVSIGGPVGKGTADSAHYLLDYYIPLSAEP
jgi:hypothetical protein